MHYSLSFFDETGRTREVCEADFEADSTAMLWMRIIGAERSLHPNWAMMELRQRNRSIARVPAHVLRSVWNSRWHYWRDI